VAVVSSDVAPLRQQVTEARSVQHRARRDDLVLRQTAEFPCDPGQDVARITDHHDDSIWAVLHHLGDELLEDSDVPLRKVKT